MKLLKEIFKELAMFVLFAILATLTVLVIQKANASDFSHLDYQEVFYDVNPLGVPHFGEIHHKNKLTFQKEDSIHEVETHMGTIKVKIDRVSESCDTAPDCPDVMSIIDLPEGVIARPTHVITPEKKTKTIKLYIWKGA